MKNKTYGCQLCGKLQPVIVETIIVDPYEWEGGLGALTHSRHAG